MIKQALLAQITGQGGGGLFGFLGNLFAPSAAATGGLGRSGVSQSVPTLPTYAPPASIAAPVIRAASTASRTVSINAPINVKVEGGSRGADADRELAAQIGGQVQAAVRSIIAEELILQKRQGGLLSG